MVQRYSLKAAKSKHGNALDRYEDNRNKNPKYSKFAFINNIKKKMLEKPQVNDNVGCNGIVRALSRVKQ
jgi:hypothetical protein